MDTIDENPLHALFVLGIPQCGRIRRFFTCFFSRFPGLRNVLGSPKSKLKSNAIRVSRLKPRDIVAVPCISSDDPVVSDFYLGEVVDAAEVLSIIFFHDNKTVDHNVRPCDSSLPQSQRPQHRLPSKTCSPHIVNRQFFYRGTAASLDSKQLPDMGVQQLPVGVKSLLADDNFTKFQFGHCRQLRCQHTASQTPTQPRPTGISSFPLTSILRGPGRIRRSFGISASDCLSDSFVSRPIKTKA